VKVILTAQNSPHVGSVVENTALRHAHNQPTDGAHQLGQYWEMVSDNGDRFDNSRFSLSHYTVYLGAELFFVVL
jgi:hypothetical protein